MTGTTQETDLECLRNGIMEGISTNVRGLNVTLAPPNEKGAIPVLLQGRTHTYYQKQLAQNFVFDLGRVRSIMFIVTNNIEVI